MGGGPLMFHILKGRRIASVHNTTDSPDADPPSSSSCQKSMYIMYNNQIPV